MYLKLTLYVYTFCTNAMEQCSIIYFIFLLPRAAASINWLVSIQSIFLSKFLNKGISNTSI